MCQSSEFTKMRIKYEQSRGVWMNSLDVLLLIAVCSKQFIVFYYIIRMIEL